MVEQDFYLHIAPDDRNRRGDLMLYFHQNISRRIRDTPSFPKGTQWKYLLELISIFWKNQPQLTIEGCDTITVFSDVYLCAVRLLEKIIDDISWADHSIRVWSIEDYVGATVIDADNIRNLHPDNLKLMIEHKIKWKDGTGMLMMIHVVNQDPRHLWDRFLERYQQQVELEIATLFKPVQVDDGGEVESQLMMELHLREAFMKYSSAADEDETEWGLNLGSNEVIQLHDEEENNKRVRTEGGSSWTI